jgi:cytochrome c oxidase subunit 2
MRTPLPIELQKYASDGLEGQNIFFEKPCEFCHTIRGTSAQGRVGPDLTHIGSRRAIEGNMLPNNDANLEAWVTSAQSLKPGCMMPNITQFDGEQIRSLVSYLRQLQ